MKRRIYHGLETDRKLAFLLARQLHLQETQRQLPFPESRLGRLPGEIRQMVYEYVLVAPPSQLTRYLRVPVLAATDSDVAPAGGMISYTASAKTPQHAPVQHARPARVSYVAILQTCRQVHREAYHVFYARNAFHFTEAPILIGFLRGIGPLRRAELTSLNLEGLVVDQDLWTKEVLDHYCIENNIGPDERKELEADRYLAIHPKIREATKLLDDCMNLSRLLLEMRTSERFEYFLFVWMHLGSEKAVVYLVDDSRWVVRWPCTEEEKGVAWDTETAKRNVEDSVDKWFAYTKCYPTREAGDLFRVAVDIIRGPEEALERGYQSWVAIR